MIDTIAVYWPSGKYQEVYNTPSNSTLTFNESEATLNGILKLEESNFKLKQNNQLLAFTHKENEFNDFIKEGLLPYKQSTLGPLISKGDVNGDQKDDIYIGGYIGQSGQLFITHQFWF